MQGGPERWRCGFSVNATQSFLWSIQLFLDDLSRNWERIKIQSCAVKVTQCLGVIPPARHNGSHWSHAHSLILVHMDTQTHTLAVFSSKCVSLNFHLCLNCTLHLSVCSTEYLCPASGHWIHCQHLCCCVCFDPTQSSSNSQWMSQRHRPHQGACVGWRWWHQITGEAALQARVGWFPGPDHHRGPHSERRDGRLVQSWYVIHFSCVFSPIKY